MKSIWNGSLSFGLVNIPVKMYSAVEAKAVSFRLLHKKHNAPIHFKRWCDECKKEVKWDEIVKGLEVAKDQYYIFTKEELKSIRPERTNSIDIIKIIDSHQLDPIYFDNHYYLGPEKKKEKPFFLFKEILQETAKAAVGRFVMREKEYICIVTAYRKGMLLTTLNYAYEIRDIDALEELKSGPKFRKEEQELAKQLINKIYDKNFDIAEYKDTFAEELKKLIKKKEKGEPIEIVEAEKEETSEENLVEALKASLR